MKPEDFAFIDDLVKDSQNYVNRTNLVFQKYLQRRALAKEDVNTQKEELAKAKRIFEDELRAC